MWQFLQRKKYMLPSGDGCDIDAKDYLPEIKDSECPDQCKAIEIQDEETASLKDCPYKAEVSLMAQKRLQPVCLKVFNSMLLRAWRKQREKKLDLEEIIKQQTCTISKFKNQLQIYKTLHRIEQKHNSQLKKQLTNAVLHAKDVSSTCDNLTTGLISLKADHSLMEQELECKCRELNSLNLLLDRTKADLFKSIYEQETLRAALDAARRSKKLLEAEKDKLIKRNCAIGIENRKLKKKYCKELEKKSKELERAKKIIEGLEAQEKAELDAVKTNLESSAQLERELKTARMQVVLLQRTIDESLVARCTYYWGKFNRYKAHAVHLIISATVLMLPAFPPPHTLSTMLKY